MAIERNGLTELDEARAALDIVEHAAREIARSLDGGDLDAADAALDERERALSGLGTSLAHVTDAWSVSGGPSPAEAAVVQEVRARVARVAEDGARLMQALERAQARGHEGLRQVRCGNRLAEHQRTRGISPAGGWLDTRR